MFNSLINFIQEQYCTEGPIALHEPVFNGREHEYVNETIDSTFVSSVGSFVNRFEREMETYTCSPKAVVAVNGTAALHTSLILAGVCPGELVITQPLTFVATCNAIAYCMAEPLFIDVDRLTLSLSPIAVDDWLCEHAELGEDGLCRTRHDKKVIRACVPMHTFGHPADMDGLLEVCRRWNLALIEDAAESLGSFYKDRHTGTIGTLGVLSFNGNKIITTGGGGMILAGEKLGARAKHLTTTAKKPHSYEYVHDELGYNYRLPNLNAALGCASRYNALLKGSNLQFVTEPEHCRSNYWLNALICENRVERDALLKVTNDKGVMTRPIWTLMNNLPMYANCLRGELKNAEWLEARVVNLPSSVLPEDLV